MAEDPRRIREDRLDDLDEELELEPEDEGGARGREGRKRYFRERPRLQGELIKLQDWIVATRGRLVVIFEGGDAARVPVPPEMIVPQVY